VIFYLKYPFQKKADIVSLEIEKLLQKGAIFLTFETDQFLFLAMRELVQDKKNHVRFTGKCMLYSLCQLPPPILHAFPFYNKQFTVYKFSIIYKQANPKNQPYYYIITFT
jgi:hypothetical protein